MIGARRMLANRKTIVADGLVCQIGDALEDLGAADLEQRSYRSGVDSTGHQRYDANLSCLQRKHIEFDARYLPDEFAKGRIVSGDLRLYDLLETVQVTRRTANAGHAGALVAEKKLRIGPAFVFLSDQVLGRDTHVFEKDVVHLMRAVDGYDGTHGDAGRFHVDQQERNAGLRFRRGI